MTELSKEIKAYRTRLGLTQVELSKLLGVSVATYVSYENNPFSMSLSIFIKLCEIMGKEFSEIFFKPQLYNMYNNIKREEE